MERRGSSWAGIPEVANNYKTPKVSSNFQRGGCCPELTTTAQKHFTKKSCQHLLNFWDSAGCKHISDLCLVKNIWLLVRCEGMSHLGTGAAITQPSPCPVQLLLPKWCSLHRARQTARLQTANLLQESSSQPRKHGIPQAWRMWDLQAIISQYEAYKRLYKSTPDK